MSSENLDKFAVLISHLTNPIVITIPLGLLFLYLTGIGFFEALKWILLSFIVALLPIILYIYIKPDLNLENIGDKDQRHTIYVLGLLTGLTLIGVLYILPTPAVLRIYSIGGYITGVIGLIANRFHKVSLHTGIIAGFATGTMFFSTEIGILLYLLAGIVSWSRVRLGKHSVEEVFIGSLIPTICISLTFLLLL